MWCHLFTKFASYKVPPVMVSTHGSVVPLAMFSFDQGRAVRQGQSGGLCEFPKRRRRVLILSQRRTIKCKRNMDCSLHHRIASIRFRIGGGWLENWVKVIKVFLQCWLSYLWFQQQVQYVGGCASALLRQFCNLQTPEGQFCNRNSKTCDNDINEQFSAQNSILSKSP